MEPAPFRLMERLFRYLQHAGDGVHRRCGCARRARMASRLTPVRPQLALARRDAQPSAAIARAETASDRSSKSPQCSARVCDHISCATAPAGIGISVNPAPGAWNRKYTLSMPMISGGGTRKSDEMGPSSCA